ncbi:MAG TPA: ATP-binding protein [Streptosporangiaceae bacterium]|nr:ATP-binding protein [Streptosporangiaceae bacterium]
MTERLAGSATLSVRMRDVPGIADSDWFTLSNGITVLTGRNNVGKTHLLKAIAGLRPGMGWFAQLPVARIELGDMTIELETGHQAVLERYEVTSAAGTVTAAWEPDPNNRGMSKLSISDGSRGVVVRDGERDVWNSWSLPSKALAEAALTRLTFVPAQRAIPGTVPARRLKTPGPSGTDLGMAIFTRRNDDAPEFHELQRVMAELFPEIGAILTQAVDDDQPLVRITYRDRFAGRNTPLDESGTGVAQALHLVSLVLFSEPGRIFLIDEPHAFLHPGSERRLVRFLLDHPEHTYVCATHSPVFLNATDPEACWLVTRDTAGTAMHPVFADGFGRRHLFAELGIEPGDVALAEHVLFVEGPSDKASYPLILAQLGYDVVARNCSVISLHGADLSRPLAEVLRQLATDLLVPFTILLDGDKRAEYAGNTDVVFLPSADLEKFLIQDPTAVRAGMLAVIAEEAPALASSAAASWPDDAVAVYLTENTRPETRAADLLNGLARKMGTSYRKPVMTPKIAEHLCTAVAEQLRPSLLARLEFSTTALASP